MWLCKWNSLFLDADTTTNNGDIVEATKSTEEADDSNKVNDAVPASSEKIKQSN